MPCVRDTQEERMTEVFGKAKTEERVNESAQNVLKGELE